MQSSGLVFLFHSGELFGTGSNIDLIKDFTAPRVLFIILVFTAGTAVVMWLAELITQRGIGNGDVDPDLSPTSSRRCRSMASRSRPTRAGLGSR